MLLPLLLLLLLMIMMMLIMMIIKDDVSDDDGNNVVLVVPSLAFQMETDNRKWLNSIPKGGEGRLSDQHEENFL